MPTFVELGQILKDRNPRLAHLRRQFMDLILNGFLPGVERRLDEAKRLLDQRDCELLRARLRVIKGGK
jgi:hypothetical protein